MKNIVFILLILFVTCCLIGCNNNSIQFKRDSAFSDLMQGMTSQSGPKVKKSSGVVIYRDTSSQTQPKNENSSSGFGPGDLNFDMPIKFK